MGRPNRRTRARQAIARAEAFATDARVQIVEGWAEGGVDRESPGVAVVPEVDGRLIVGERLTIATGHVVVQYPEPRAGRPAKPGWTR